MSNKIVLELNPEQVEQLIERLPMEDKIRLAQRLDSETWQVRFKYLLHRIDSRLKNRKKLSNENIVKLVKRVRKHNYAQGYH